jgi:hypothetical protein
MTFEKNIGHRDAQLRTVAAAVVIVVAMFLVNNPWVKIVLAVVSAALAVSAYFHSCYLYKLLGLQTLDGKVTHATDKPVESMPATSNETTTPADSDKVA